jgi:hypothetical protein
MEKILYLDQHGFCGNRSIQTATAPVLEAIHDEETDHHASYFTRWKDGIPVPTLKMFMTGYRNLFKLDILSKTLENSYLVMNRQVWTDEENYLSRDGKPGGGGGETVRIMSAMRKERKHYAFTVAAKKHDRSGNGSSAHTLIVGVLESITCYCPVYWDVADKIYLIR